MAKKTIVPSSFELPYQGISARKESIKQLSEKHADSRDVFIERRAAFHKGEWDYLRFLIPAGLKVLEIGCSTGKLLGALEPSEGVGIDISPRVLELARQHYPQYRFIEGDIENPVVLSQLGGPFDVIVLSDTLGLLDDCQATLTNLRALCHAETRLVISFHSYLWEPLLKLAEKMGGRIPQPHLNWLRPNDISNLLTLADFETVRRDARQIVPVSLFGLGRFINRYIGTLPLIRRLCLRNYIVARPLHLRTPPQSATVLVPCRNEQGNIAAIVERLPLFCKDMEIMFVEGNSKDDTWNEIERVMARFPDRDIKRFKQSGKGKGDAVRKGFAEARGEVLMILDADMTVPPEDLPKFFKALEDDKAEFINGSRLIYPMEDQAMRILNRLANHAFSVIFSFLLNQRFTDTLCGTKVLRRKHYLDIAHNRNYFGDFDPFGDFDLIFGAAKLNLKIIEVPIRYAARTYGETQISRFTHGWLLLRMVVFAWRKLKAF
jgi:SAM-dependent methyltransferase